MRTGDRGDVLRDGIEVRALIDDRRALPRDRTVRRGLTGHRRGPRRLGKSTRRALIEVLFPAAVFDHDRGILHVALPIAPDRPLDPHRPKIIASGRRSPSGDLRDDLGLVEAHEAVLIRADLVHVDVVEPDRFEPADGLEMPIRIRAADDRVGDVAFGDELDGRLEPAPVSAALG
jgi:hypothetical protein